MNIKSILVILVCVILESTIVSYPLTLFAVVMISIFLKNEAIILAFAAGLILDFATLRFLGLDSLYFLFLLYLTDRYGKKIHEGAILYRLGYLLVSYFIYSFLFYRKINIAAALVTAVFGIAALLLFERLFPNVGSKKRLAV